MAASRREYQWVVGWMLGAALKNKEIKYGRGDQWLSESMGGVERCTGLGLGGSGMWCWGGVGDLQASIIVASCGWVL